MYTVNNSHKQKIYSKTEFDELPEAPTEPIKPLTSQSSHLMDSLVNDAASANCLREHLSNNINENKSSSHYFPSSSLLPATPVKTKSPKKRRTKRYVYSKPRKKKKLPSIESKISELISEKLNSKGLDSDSYSSSDTIIVEDFDIPSNNNLTSNMLGSFPNFGSRPPELGKLLISSNMQKASQAFPIMKKEPIDSDFNINNNIIDKNVQALNFPIKTEPVDISINDDPPVLAPAIAEVFPLKKGLILNTSNFLPSENDVLHNSIKTHSNNLKKPKQTARKRTAPRGQIESNNVPKRNFTGSSLHVGELINSSVDFFMSNQNSDNSMLETTVNKPGDNIEHVESMIKPVTDEAKDSKTTANITKSSVQNVPPMFINVSATVLQSHDLQNSRKATPRKKSRSKKKSPAKNKKNVKGVPISMVLNEPNASSLNRDLQMIDFQDYPLLIDKEISAPENVTDNRLDTMKDSSKTASKRKGGSKKSCVPKSKKTRIDTTPNDVKLKYPFTSVLTSDKSIINFENPFLRSNKISPYEEVGALNNVSCMPKSAASDTTISINKPSLILQSLLDKQNSVKSSPKKKKPRWKYSKKRTAKRNKNSELIDNTELSEPLKSNFDKDLSKREFKNNFLQENEIAIDKIGESDDLSVCLKPSAQNLTNASICEQSVNLQSLPDKQNSIKPRKTVSKNKQNKNLMPINEMELNDPLISLETDLPMIELGNISQPTNKSKAKGKRNRKSPRKRTRNKKKNTASSRANFCNTSQEKSLETSNMHQEHLFISKQQNSSVVSNNYSDLNVQFCVPNKASTSVVNMQSENDLHKKLLHCESILLADNSLGMTNSSFDNVGKSFEDTKQSRQNLCNMSPSNVVTPPVLSASKKSIGNTLQQFMESESFIRDSKNNKKPKNVNSNEQLFISAQQSSSTDVTSDFRKTGSVLNIKKEPDDFVYPYNVSLKQLSKEASLVGAINSTAENCYNKNLNAKKKNYLNDEQIICSVKPQHTNITIKKEICSDDECSIIEVIEAPKQKSKQRKDPILSRLEDIDYISPNEILLSTRSETKRLRNELQLVTETSPKSSKTSFQEKKRKCKLSTSPKTSSKPCNNESVFSQSFESYIPNVAIKKEVSSADDDLTSVTLPITTTGNIPHVLLHDIMHNFQANIESVCPKILDLSTPVDKSLKNTILPINASNLNRCDGILSRNDNSNTENNYSKEIDSTVKTTVALELMSDLLQTDISSEASTNNKYVNAAKLVTVDDNSKAMASTNNDQEKLSANSVTSNISLSRTHENVIPFPNYSDSCLIGEKFIKKEIIDDIIEEVIFPDSITEKSASQFKAASAKSTQNVNPQENLIQFKSSTADMERYTIPLSTLLPKNILQDEDIRNNQLTFKNYLDNNCDSRKSNSSQNDTEDKNEHMQLKTNEEAALQHNYMLNKRTEQVNNDLLPSKTSSNINSDSDKPFTQKSLETGKSSRYFYGMVSEYLSYVNLPTDTAAENKDTASDFLNSFNDSSSKPDDIDSTFPPRFSTPINQDLINCARDSASPWIGTENSSDSFQTHSSTVSFSYRNNELNNSENLSNYEKNINIFFKYPHPGDFLSGSFKFRHIGKGKTYSRTNPLSINLSYDEVASKMRDYASNGFGSIKDEGDVNDLDDYPLIEEEIECYHRIIGVAPSQKLISMCNKVNMKLCTDIPLEYSTNKFEKPIVPSDSFMNHPPLPNYLVSDLAKAVNIVYQPEKERNLDTTSINDNSSLLTINNLNAVNDNILVEHNIQSADKLQSLSERYNLNEKCNMQVPIANIGKEKLDSPLMESLIPRDLFSKLSELSRLAEFGNNETQIEKCQSFTKETSRTDKSPLFVNVKDFEPSLNTGSPKYQEHSCLNNDIKQDTAPEILHTISNDTTTSAQIVFKSSTKKSEDEQSNLLTNSDLVACLPSITTEMLYNMMQTSKLVLNQSHNHDKVSELVEVGTDFDKAINLIESKESKLDFPPVIENKDGFQESVQLKNHTDKLSNEIESKDLASEIHDDKLSNEIESKDLPSEIHDKLSNEIESKDLPSEIHDDKLSNKIETEDLLSEIHKDKLSSKTEWRTLSPKIPDVIKYKCNLEEPTPHIIKENRLAKIVSKDVLLDTSNIINNKDSFQEHVSPIINVESPTVFYDEEKKKSEEFSTKNTTNLVMSSSSLNAVDMPKTELLKILQTANSLNFITGSQQEGTSFVSGNRNFDTFNNSIPHYSNASSNICRENPYYDYYSPFLKIPVVHDYGHKSLADSNFISENSDITKDHNMSRKDHDGASSDSDMGNDSEFLPESTIADLEQESKDHKRSTQKKLSEEPGQLHPTEPQYKSRWERIMERKALEIQPESKQNDHLLKDCFPVSDKLAEGKLKKSPVKNQGLQNLVAFLKKNSEQSLPLPSAEGISLGKKSDHSNKQKNTTINYKLNITSKKKNINSCEIRMTPTSSTEQNSGKSTSLKKNHDKHQPTSLDTSFLKKNSSKEQDVSIKKLKGQSHICNSKINKKLTSPKKKLKPHHVVEDYFSNLFTPDKIVRKLDEKKSNISSKTDVKDKNNKVYGRVTNRGSFLTQSSLNKIPKPKVSHPRKNVTKIKGSSIFSDEIHSMVNTPEIKLAPETVAIPKHVHNFYEESNNSSIDMLGFEGYSVKRSSLSNSEYSLSPESSFLSLTSDFFQNSESVSSKFSSRAVLPERQTSKSVVEPRFKPQNPELSNISENANKTFSSTELDISTPIFASSPVTNLSFTFGSSYNDLSSPSLSSATHFPSNIHQKLKRQSKCICLPPRHMKESVGYSIFDTLNVLLLILEWNVDWLLQQRKNPAPPPISKAVNKVINSYDCFENYYNTYFPLLLLEIWQRIYVSWNHLHSAPPYICEITSYIEEETCIKVECQTIFNPTDSDRGLFPEEGNVIMVKFGTKGKGGIKILGYVTHVKIRAVNPSIDSQSKCYQMLKCSPSDHLQLLQMTFLGAYTSEDFDKKLPIRVHVLCNVKSNLKQNDALLKVKDSPLGKNILNPLEDEMRVVCMVSRNSNDDKVVSCVREIVQGILSPHPIPIITIVKSSPSADRLVVLPPLIKRMKDSYGTKVLLCARTTKGLIDIGLNLDEHNINVVITGKRADVPQKLKKYLVEDLAVSRALNEQMSDGNVQDESLCKENLKPEILMVARKAILNECDVILSLIKNCHDDYLQQAFADNDSISQMCCVIDEANLCTEPEILIPILFGISKLILIGDPDVLAKVCSKTAASYGYSKTLFHRAYELDLISG